MNLYNIKHVLIQTHIKKIQLPYQEYKKEITCQIIIL